MSDGAANARRDQRDEHDADHPTSVTGPREAVRDGLRRAGTLPPTSVDAQPPAPPVRDWREAWRAARDADTAAPTSRVQAPAPLPERPSRPATQPTQPTQPTAGSRSTHAAASQRNGPPTAEVAPVRVGPFQTDSPASPAVAAEPKPIKAPKAPKPPKAAKPPRAPRDPVETSSWIPSGHAAAAVAHAGLPGRPALPGSDPTASAAPMAVGAALPGGAGTGVQLLSVSAPGQPVDLRSALRSGVAKVRAMRPPPRPVAGPAAGTATAAAADATIAATGIAAAGAGAAAIAAAAPAPGSAPPAAGAERSAGHAPPATSAVAAPTVPTAPGAPPVHEPVTDVAGRAPWTAPGLVVQPGQVTAAPTDVDPSGQTGAAPWAGAAVPSSPDLGAAAPYGIPAVPPPPGFGPTPLPVHGAPVAIGAPLGAAAGALAVASSATMTDQSTSHGGAPTAVLSQPGGPTGPVGGRRPAAPRPAKAPKAPRRGGGGGIRRAHLKLTRIDPWTVMKVSFMLAIAFGIMTVVSVGVVWSMLDAAGVFDEIAESVSAVTGDAETAGFDILSWVAFDRVMGFATLLAVVDVVLITALATLFAFLYNLASTLLGGVEVTLVEDHR